MKKIAVYAGSFDPPTRGHLDIIERAAALFDELIVAIGQNTRKEPMFLADDRKRWIRKCVNRKNVRVDIYEGMTTEYCKTVKAGWLVRGLRSAADFEYERYIGELNHTMSGIESVFFVSRPEHAHISSSIVREILHHKGDVSQFVPEKIEGELRGGVE